jgi:hypothetical protein
MQLFPRYFLIALSSLFLSTSLAAAAQQCVSLSGKYQATVQWYDAKHVTIDNSEPWNNKLVIHKTKQRGQGRCGADAATGQQICEGFPVNPIKTDKLKPLGTTSSCINGAGDKFAIVRCDGCAKGTKFLTSAIGSIANLALPGSAAFQALGVVGDAFGVNTTAAANALIKTTQKGLKIKSKTNVALPIHDISALPDPQDIIYVGTPKAVKLVGNFQSAIGKEGAVLANKDPGYAVGIDCHHSALDPKITNTPDTITVEFWVGNNKVAEDKHFNDISCSNAEHRWSKWKALRLAQRPSHIVVTTNGSNAFYIDQINMKFYKDGQITGPNLLGSAGADNGKGWCLSKDRNDINGTFKKYASSCQTSIRFNTAGNSGDRERTCFDLVQGKVAWNTKGSKLWGVDNLKNFCKGTQNPQKRVSCFDNLVQRGKLSWQIASNSCQKF